MAHLDSDVHLSLWVSVYALGYGPTNMRNHAVDNALPLAKQSID